jgi:hypothetical protein
MYDTYLGTFRILDVIAPVVGIVVTAVALVVVTVLVIHYSKKRAITGCVVSGQSGITLIDEKDKQIYTLSRLWFQESTEAS